MTVTSIITGLSMGATVLLGQKLDQGCRDETGDLPSVGAFCMSVAGADIAIVAAQGHQLSVSFLAITVVNSLEVVASAGVGVAERLFGARQKERARRSLLYGIGSSFCFAGYFNGCDKITFVMIQGVIRAFCICIPVSLAMSRL